MPNRFKTVDDMRDWLSKGGSLGEKGASPRAAAFPRYKGPAASDIPFNADHVEEVGKLIASAPNPGVLINRARALGDRHGNSEAVGQLLAAAEHVGSEIVSKVLYNRWMELKERESR